MSDQSGVAGLLCRLLALLLLLGITAADDCRSTEKGLDYVGRVNRTVTGRTCKRWSLKPSCFGGLVEYYPAEAENFCRNPRGFSDCQLAKPWCHTTDGRREYCDVPVCGYKVPACSHALGLESGSIKDSQITASSSMSGHEPRQARLNSGNEDGHAGWVASTVGDNQYLKIDLVTLHNVTKVILQGSGKTANAYTKQFKVQYSEDGNTWTFYKAGGQVKLLGGNPKRTHGISHSFDPPLRTRFFVVVPTEWHERPALRLEVHGCAIRIDGGTTKGPTTQATPTKETTTHRVTRMPDNSPTTRQPAKDFFRYLPSIGGQVKEDTRLRKMMMPYVVDSSLVVCENATLTIDGGVTLLFKRGRGILVKGTLNLRGSADQHIYFNRSLPTSNLSWSGIVIEKNSRTHGVKISNVVISGSDVGLRIQKNGVVNIHNCSFSNNNKGVEILSEYANVSIIDSQFRSNNYGIDLVDRGTFTISRCRFTQQNEFAIRGFKNSSRRHPETVSISDNVFAENNQSIQLNLSYRTSLCLVRNKFENETAHIFPSITLKVWHSNVTVEGNEFLRMKFGALLIAANESSNIIIVRNNTWKCGGRPLSIFYAGRYGPRTTENTTTIEKNVFHANSGGVSLFYNGSTVVRIRCNNFTENTGQSVIHSLTENTIPLEIYSNTFSMNSVKDGVIHALEPCVISNNSFNNPNSSHDLVLGGFPGGNKMESYGRGGTTNATHNWWGVATRSGVERRIRIVDNPRLAVKHTVQWDRFLTHDPLVSCAKLANCSIHGVCVGANSCRCEDGWLLPNCSQATCEKVYNCSGHGQCIAPNRCNCSEGFAGAACDTCAPGRVGPLCDKCKPYFYGRRCMPLSVFNQSHYFVNVTEGVLLGTYLRALNATARDNVTVRYSILGGESGLPFRLHPKSGTLMVTGELDRETKSNYTLHVYATSGDAVQIPRGNSTIYVTVLDVNDNPPMFSSGDKHLTINANKLSPVVPIATVNATDKDAGRNAIIYYKLLTNPVSKANFTIDNKTGAVFVSGYVKDGDYVLTITATDCGQPALSTTKQIDVTIEHSGTTACYVVDVAFAVDTAGSIAKENWSRMTDFFVRLLARMEVSRKCARVSVVTFGSAATLQFDLHAYNDAGSLGRAIGRLDMRNQSRNFADGIRKVRSDVFQDRYGDRKNATNWCVLITDGTSGVEYANSLAEVARAKADGIVLQIVGIGRHVSMAELSSMAKATHLKDYADLEGNKMLQQVYSDMLGLKPTPAATTSAPPPPTTTTTEQSTTTSFTSDFTWQCSFEGATGNGSMCGMTQSSSADFDWTLISGGTPSSETGPSSGYGGSGYYIFIEASTPRQMGDTAMILLPSFKQDGVFCLSFNYNMNGWHTNTLQVVKRSASGPLDNLWMKKGKQGPQWHADQVTVDLHSSQQLAFIGIRGKGYSGDIAVDNVSVKSGRCLA